MTPILQIVLAILSIIVAFIAGIALPISRSRRQYGIRWAILEPKSMMEIAEEIAKDINIQYKDRIITDLTKYRFIIHNTGSSSLEHKDIVEPLIWTGPGPVLSARVVVSDPPVPLSLNIKDNAVEFSWALFNQRCKALIEILCENRTPTEKGHKGHISGQIRNVSSIDEKQVAVEDEDEILKRYGGKDQFVSPVLIIVLRLFKWLGYLYFVALIPWLSYLFLPTIYFIYVSVAVMFVAGIMVVYLRNPYASLIKKARQLSDKGVRT